MLEHGPRIFGTFPAQLRYIGWKRLGGQNMVLRLSEQMDIEDLRNHPREIVESLRQVLAAGAPARPDPHRKDFYELEDGSRVFYIYISPLNGKVLLLATWQKDEEPVAATIAAAAHLA